MLCAFTKLNLGIRQLSAFLREQDFDVTMLFIEDYGEIQANMDLFSAADVVGVSLVTDEFFRAASLGEEIKKARSERRPVIVFGGVHPTIRPEECLKYCDFVVRGEGEETLLAICRDIENIRNMSNVSYLENGSLVNNELRNLEEDLDRFPFLDQSDLSANDRYMIITSRGCPFSCTYCYNSYLKSFYKDKGRFLRKRSIDNVISELQQAKEKFKNLNLIQFFDDNFIARPIEEISYFCSEYKSKIDIPFYCLANPDLISEEKIGMLSEAGLAHIQIGIQSGSERVNYNVYKRKIPNKKIMDCAEICRKYSVAVYFDIIFNNPYETRKDVKETFDLVNSLPRPFHLQGHNLLFYPQTEITEMALRDGFISRLDPEEVNELAVKGNMNSPLCFSNDLANSFYRVHYTTKGKVRLNNLITLSQILPKTIINIIKWLPGDVVFYAKWWLKLKRNRSFREEHFYRLIRERDLQQQCS